MRLTSLLVPTFFLLAGVAPAQLDQPRPPIGRFPTPDPPTYLRGEVRPDAANGYYLHCTTWPVKFSMEVEDSWVGEPLLMTVTNLGDTAYPVVNVMAVKPTNKTFDLGMLQIGMMAKAKVVANPGAFAQVCLDTPSHVRWTTLGDTGVWLLGPEPCGFAEGFASDLTGEFRFHFKVPLLDTLVGTTFTGQAIVLDPLEGLFLTNADCQTVVGG